MTPSHASQLRRRQPLTDDMSNMELPAQTRGGVGEGGGGGGGGGGGDPSIMTSSFFFVRIKGGPALPSMYHRHVHMTHRAMGGDCHEPWAEV